MAEIERVTDRSRAGRQAPPDDFATRLDEFLRRQGWMDGIADAIQGVIGTFYVGLRRPGRSLKSLLHGTTVLGHPLHPAVTDVPLGAWTAAVVADWAAHVSAVVPPAAGDVALAVGTLAGLLAVASGYTDFHETYGQERRYGLSHGVTMTAALIVMVVSLGIRWLWGGEGSVVAAFTSTIGLALALAGAFLGGHLSFGLGTMVNHLAFAEGPEEFVAVGTAADFPEGQLCRASADGLAVLIVRLNGRLCAIANTCTHAGGPLNEGSLEGDIVTCPWHGSRFCIRNGQVLDGPATFDQPVMQVREEAGTVQVKLARPMH